MRVFFAYPLLFGLGHLAGIHGSDAPAPRSPTAVSASSPRYGLRPRYRCVRSVKYLAFVVVIRPSSEACFVSLMSSQTWVAGDGRTTFV